MEIVRMKSKIMEVMNEYAPNEDMFSDEEEYMYQLKKALEALQPADKIIMLMYCESGSLRETGKELGVSHTIVYKQIQKIRQQMYDYIRVNFPDNCDMLLDRFKRYCNINEESNLEMGVQG